MNLIPTEHAGPVVNIASTVEGRKGSRSRSAGREVPEQPPRSKSSGTSHIAADQEQLTASGGNRKKKGIFNNSKVETFIVPWSKEWPRRGLRVIRCRIRYPPLSSIQTWKSWPRGTGPPEPESEPEQHRGPRGADLVLRHTSQPGHVFLLPPGGTRPGGHG